MRLHLVCGALTRTNASLLGAFRASGVDAIATPIHAPKANAVAERATGALRRECLDHLIVIDVQYYNQERPPRTLELQTPQLKERPTIGIVRSRHVLNGLHHIYERAA